MQPRARGTSCETVAACTSSRRCCHRQVRGDDMNRRSRSFCLLAVAAALGGSAAAQQYVYPAKGQTPEKQKSDEAACHTWAIQQTGFDPAKPPPPPRPAADDGDRHDARRRGARRGQGRGGRRGRGGDAGPGLPSVRLRRAARAAGRTQRPRIGAAAAAGRPPAATGRLRQGARSVPRRQGLHGQVMRHERDEVRAAAARRRHRRRDGAARVPALSEAIAQAPAGTTNAALNCRPRNSRSSSAGSRSIRTTWSRSSCRPRPTRCRSCRRTAS